MYLKVNYRQMPDQTKKCPVTTGHRALFAMLYFHKMCFCNHVYEGMLFSLLVFYCNILFGGDYNIQKT